MIESRKISSEAEWLEWRRHDITASTAAALFDRHPYTTQLKLYLEKRGVEFIQPDDRVLRRGRWLEPAVAKAAAEKRPEWKLEPAGVYLRDTELRLGATPDFFIHGDPRGLGVLQTKTCAPSVFEREWDRGREVPFWIAIQTLVEAKLANATFGVVAVLVVDPFAMDIYLLDVPRHEAAEAKIVETVQRFWVDVHVARAPQADFARDAEAISVLTPRESTGKVLDVSGHNRLPEMLARRAVLAARMKDDDSRKNEIENEIRLIMGDAERAVGLAGWLINFKSIDRAGYTVAPKRIRSLRITDRRPAHERPIGAEDDDVAAAS